VTKKWRVKEEKMVEREKKLKDTTPTVQWPNIDKKFRISDSDFCKALGCWRGAVDAKVSPAQAASKLIMSEKQLTETVHRHGTLRFRAASKEPLLYQMSVSSVPIKMAQGQPAAQDVLPYEGERVTRSLCGLPTHRCRPPAFPEQLQVDVYVQEEAKQPANGAQDAQGQVIASKDAERTKQQRMAMVARKSIDRAKAGRQRQMHETRVLSHMQKPRSFSETEKMWKSPEFSKSAVQPRLYEDIYAQGPDGTLTSWSSIGGKPRFDTNEDEFDRLTVRELMVRSMSESGRTNISSKDQLRSPALHARLITGRPEWAKAERKNTVIVGDPALKKTCVIQPLPPQSEIIDTWKLPDHWMTRVPNLGRITDPYCHDLCSQPLYCFNLDHARHGREDHMISSLGVYRGGPSYNIKTSSAIDMRLRPAKAVQV
jgi:hypothetical protein